MTRRPELKALEVFESAARLGGFQKAARELGVTGSAVSHQIRVLEDLVGVPLFTRSSGIPVLTAAGRTLSRRASAAFREIEAGLDEVGAARADAALCVSAPPHFAARFLVGRLERFAKRHPAIQVKLSVESRHVDFDREPVDLAVRFGSGAWTGLRAEMLFRPRIAAVCAPGVLAPGATSGDLARQTWLRLSIEGDAQARYFTAAGITLAKPMAELRFDTFVAALQAALDGQGVMLVPLETVRPLLAQRRLVLPFTSEMAAAHGFHVVAPPARFDQPKVAAFRRWLRGEIRTALAA
jgi:LysR family transcriptional regulator, glycine cleavage system transcriptional activator